MNNQYFIKCFTDIFIFPHVLRGICCTFCCVFIKQNNLKDTNKFKIYFLTISKVIKANFKKVSTNTFWFKILIEITRLLLYFYSLKLVLYALYAVLSATFIKRKAALSYQTSKRRLTNFKLFLKNIIHKIFLIFLLIFHHISVIMRIKTSRLPPY